MTILAWTSTAFCQSKVIGKVDPDGIPHFTTSKTECTDQLKNVSASKGSFTLNVQEVTITQMPKGQFCLTGYEKDITGKISKGIRVECKQDDDNNLIITDKSKTETITGRGFGTPVTSSL